MKRFASICSTLIFVLTIQAQQSKELYLESFDASNYRFISINSSYGNVYLQPSHDQIGARAQFVFSDEISAKALKLFDAISIEKSERNDSIFLTTKFDESLFLKNNTLWEIKDDINIEYRVKVPAHGQFFVHQKHGHVYVGRTDIPVGVYLDNSGLTSKLSDKIKISGSDFSVDASGVKEMTISGSRGHLVLSNIGEAKVDLKYSAIESIGFHSIEGKLDNCTLSSGKTNSCDLSINKSTIEFTNIIESAIFDLTDVRFVIQKMPELFKMNALRGSSKFSLSPGRNCRFNLSTQDSEMELRLKNGTVLMEYEAKKTLLAIPEGGVLSKKQAEFAQSGNHGTKITGLFKRGRFIIKK